MTQKGKRMFLNDFKFFYKNSLQSNKVFVSVVTLCDIFILDLNDFSGLNVL